jgi:flagellin-like hook-associated protein FlgL
MPIVLNTNSAATEATFNLSKANDNLRRSIARLSSGNRITKPTDDAGGLAVAYKLQSSVKRTEASLNNHQNALSFLQVQDGVLEAMGDIVDRMAELRTMAADVSKNAADVENYSKEFLELQDQLAQMKREKFNGVELFAVENEQDAMKGINKSHLIVNGELHDNVNGKTYANKAEYEYFDDPLVERRTKSSFDKFEFQLYTNPSGVEEDGNIKLNIVNLQFMLGLKNPNEQFGVEYNIDTDGDGVITDAEWAASTFDRDGDGTMNGTEVADSGLDLSGNGALTEAAGWGNTAWDTDGDGDIDASEWDASPYNTDGTSGMSAAEQTAALAALNAANPNFKGLVDPTAAPANTIEQGDKTVSSHYVQGYGNTISVGSSLNLAGLNQVTLDTGDGALHTSNATELGGLGTNYANKLTNNTGTGYIKDITDISIEEFTNIIEKIADVRAENGAEQQRVNQSLKLQQTNLVNLEAAHGRIMDVDVAMESTRLARHSVTVQASAAMVAQANQMTAVALTLLSN